ncbi:MAG: hypothetical protein WB930_16030 [Syntrophobacteraceae bacterium]
MGDLRPILLLNPIVGTQEVPRVIIEGRVNVGQKDIYGFVSHPDLLENQSSGFSKARGEKTAVQSVPLSLEIVP